MSSACGVPNLSPAADGVANARALQAAIDRHTLVEVTCRGVLNVSKPITVRSNTHLRFVEGAVLRKVVPSGGRPYAQVLINRAALEPTSAADENVVIEGLHLDANHVDAVVQDHPVPGLRGQLGFHNVRNLSLRRTRITNLGAIQFGIQVSSFDGLWIEHVAVSGKKDGVHLGRGR